MAKRRVNAEGMAANMVSSLSSTASLALAGSDGDDDDDGGVRSSLVRRSVDIPFISLVAVRE